MDRRETNDVAELTKLTLSTFLNIGKMTHYRMQYLVGKNLQDVNPAQVNASQLAQNRDKMIMHTCLAGLGVAALLAIGISSLCSREIVCKYNINN